MPGLWPGGRIGALGYQPVPVQGRRRCVSWSSHPESHPWDWLPLEGDWRWVLSESSGDKPRVPRKCLLAEVVVMGTPVHIRVQGVGGIPGPRSAGARSAARGRESDTPDQTPGPWVTPSARQILAGLWVDPQTHRSVGYSVVSVELFPRQRPRPGDSQGPAREWSASLQGPRFRVDPATHIYPGESSKATAVCKHPAAAKRTFMHIDTHTRLNVVCMCMYL